MIKPKDNKDESAEILFQKDGHKNLLVSLGGIKMGLGMPVFEFYNALKGIECDKIFIKDINQSWYHQGINDAYSDINQLAAYLKDLIEKNEYKKVCFIGNSMGGYAALLLGSVLNIPNVIAFSPQTFIDRKNRFLFNDKRWKKELRGVYVYPKREKAFFDLKKYFNNSNFSYDGEMNIYYSPADKLDKIHAERLHKLSFVKLHSFPKGGHGLVKDLKNSGELNKIFVETFK